MFIKRVRMWFGDHWIVIMVVVVTLILIGLSIWGLASLESFYRRITLAQMPITFLVGGVHAVIFVFLYLLAFRGGLSKLDTKKFRASEAKVMFDDVIGLDAAKEEAREMVGLIQDRAKIQKIGGSIVRGLLMVGPPGCGKTLLAKAIASEAGIPFLPMSASEFIEIFVGVGASRARKLFKKARRLAYGYGGCIIFIDELDAIGRQRGSFSWGGGQEHDSTLNQILVEMDGLTSKDANVIVIGATNIPEDRLDQALLRPGRFDRKVYIDFPNLSEREKIFAYYMRKIKYDPAIDFGVLARKAVYKSPADIENIVKESALIATRKGNDQVSYKELSEAVERVDMGLKTKRHLTAEERERVAYHEAGHLVTTVVLHPTDDVFKASIISRREALGVVYRQTRQELYMHDRERLLADIKVSLGGFVAEKVKFGVTSEGVADDFRKAMQMAHSMVWRLGMGGNGFIGDYGAIPEAQISEQIKLELNRETQKIISQCVQEVEQLLTQEKNLHERFAQELLKKEELEFDEIEAICKEYGKIPLQVPKINRSA